jgi:membrane protein
MLLEPCGMFSPQPGPSTVSAMAASLRPISYWGVIMPRRGTLLNAVFRLYEHSGITMASAVAFSFIVSLFPFCIFIGALASVFGGRELAAAAVENIVQNLPERVADTLAPEVEAVMGRSRFDLLTFSAAFALVFATGSIETLRQALNEAYRQRENRSYPICLLISTVFVLVTAVSTLVLTSGLVVWPAIVARLEPAWLSRPEAAWLRTLLDSQWLSAGTRYAIAAAVIGIQLIAMHLWLAAGRRRLREVLPGVVVSVLLWLATVAFYSSYLDLNDYARFYAGLSQIMAALIFFWVTAVIVILGAELNRGIIEIRKLEGDRS